MAGRGSFGFASDASLVGLRQNASTGNRLGLSGLNHRFLTTSLVSGIRGPRLRLTLFSVSRIAETDVSFARALPEHVRLAVEKRDEVGLFFDGSEDEALGLKHIAQVQCLLSLCGTDETEGASSDSVPTELKSGFTEWLTRVRIPYRACSLHICVLETRG